MPGNPGAWPASARTQRGFINAIRVGYTPSERGGDAVALASAVAREEAIDDPEWDDGEILIVGSSRLAEKNKLFIGSTAHRVLPALPVPMVVVPRDYKRINTSP